MLRIFIETGKTTTSEYVFVKTLVERMGVDVDIICVNGKDNLRNFASKFQENTFLGGRNLIIFDADFAKNKGGFEPRKNVILQTVFEMGITTDLFLFPNNADDGDFETLLFRIARQDRHHRFFECFRDYELCLGEYYEKPNLKGQIFAYISSMPMSKSKRDRISHGEWQFDNPDYWDMESTELQPLKNAIKPTAF